MIRCHIFVKSTFIIVLLTSFWQDVADLQMLNLRLAAREELHRVIIHRDAMMVVETQRKMPAIFDGDVSEDEGETSQNIKDNTKDKDEDVMADRMQLLRVGN